MADFLAKNQYINLMINIDADTKIDFDDVLIKPKISNINSRAEVNLVRTFQFAHSPKQLSCVPIVAANMDTTGTMLMADAMIRHGCVTCLHKHYSEEDIEHYFTHQQGVSDLVFYSTGISRDDIKKLTVVMNNLRLKNITLPNVCIDVANGYHANFIKNIRLIRDIYPEIIIMAGNVVTPEIVEKLIITGKVDIVKVGIGSGSACTTRLKTGVGYPQLSAIIECSDIAHSLGAHICSDGGCRTAGDISKAFAANSDFVMLGGMLAGTDECDGEWTYEDSEIKRKISFSFYGMSSHIAQAMHGGLKGYRASEGRVMTIPYKGQVSSIIDDILGGIRSACAYTGALSIVDLPKCAEFIRVNRIHFYNAV